MKKSFKVVTEEDSVSPRDVTDWNLCLICQKDTRENLTCPANYPGSSSGYVTISKNLIEFAKLDSLPSSISLTRLDNGGGILSTLEANKAKLHKSCSLKHNTKNLIRATKRSLQETGDGGEGSEEASQSGRKRIQRSAGGGSNACAVCFFCDGAESELNVLHEVSTFEVDARVRRCAMNLQDQALIAKLSEGDLIAIEAKYHRQCLLGLYRRDQQSRTEEHKDTMQWKIFARAFAELISFIQLQIEGEEEHPVFRLKDLVVMYTERVRQLGGDTSSVHSTRLKNKILCHIPELTSYSEGRDVLLVCSDTVGLSLRRACENDADSEAFILSRAADLVRRDLLKKQPYVFTGSFPSQCQENSVPESLTTLTSLIMNGTSIDEVDHSSQAALTVAQLIAFNSSSCRRTKKSAPKRHSRCRETPLPLFIGAYIHSKVRSKEIIQTLYQLGISVSYDRVLRMSADLGNCAVKYYHDIGRVSPRFFVSDCFTVGAVDNIDHNPSATSAQGSFHGTAISLFQHVAMHPGHTEPPANEYFESGTAKRLNSLPREYAVVLPAVALRKDLNAPQLPNLSLPWDLGDISQPEILWCTAVNQYIGDCRPEIESPEDAHADLHLSWAAYHSLNTESSGILDITQSALLPLFQEDSKSVAMMRHAMGIIKTGISHLNPTQIPVMECDQPLFKLAKEIQWSCPETFGEHKFVVLLGKLHITMALLKCLGNLLESTGWTSAITDAGVASSGTADSFIKAAHVKKTLRAHQVTACALFALRSKAYQEYCASCSEDDPACIDEPAWSKARAEESPQFFFWDLILGVQQDILSFCRAVHSGDFDVYVKSLINTRKADAVILTANAQSFALISTNIFSGRSNFLTFPK